MPGFALEIKVIFKPEEYKYYNDAIRIFSEVSNTFYTGWSYESAHEIISSWPVSKYLLKFEPNSF